MPPLDAAPAPGRVRVAMPPVPERVAVNPIQWWRKMCRDQADMLLLHRDDIRVYRDKYYPCNTYGYAWLTLAMRMVELQSEMWLALGGLEGRKTLDE